VPHVVERAVAVKPEFSVVLRPRDAAGGLVLDGSVGEGGGQTLRAALTLSLLTGRPFCIEHIRRRRAKPGLLRQHLTAVRAAAAISSAELEGATLGSERLAFRPGPVRGGAHAFDIGSAGSAGLVVQTVALPLALCGEASQVRICGGTHAQWAPIYPFLEHAWLPLVRRAGADVTLALQARGFYPAGGGELLLQTTPSSALRPLHLPDVSGALELELQAEVANLPESIARRELAAVAEQLTGSALRVRSAVVRSAGPGNALWLVARPTDAAGATNVFSAVGEVGRSAENVAAQVADAFVHWRDAHTSVEEYLTDQIMLPIAIAGAGSFTSSTLSLHARTHLAVIDAFLGRRFAVWNLGECRHRLTLGAADAYDAA
jgi:RNA 3'-terminal phosphate cyclase (ATP)